MMKTKVFHKALLPALFLLMYVAMPPVSRAAPPRAIAAIHTRQEGTEGGGKPDKGHLDLSVMPDKVFNEETFMLTAQLTAPKDEDGEDKSVSGIGIGFNHTSTTLQNPTDSSGTALVNWDADHDAADENDHVILTAQVDTSHRGDYDKDDSIPGEPPDADRRGRDHETVKIVTGHVLLMADKDHVKAGNPVHLTARLDSDEADKQIEIKTYTRDVPSDDWELDTSPPWNFGGDTDETGRFKVTTPNVSFKYYRFIAWYDANGDNDGDDPDHPDDGETDKAFVDGTFQLKDIVLHGFDVHRHHAEGQDRFIYHNSAGRYPAGSQFRAEIDPDNQTVRNLNKQFKWTLANVKNPGPAPDWHTVHPGSPPGQNAVGIGHAHTQYIEFVLRHLPKDNSGFGPHQLTVEVVTHAKSKKTTARLFYYRFTKDHPTPPGTEGEDTANWYYYWSREGAGDGQQSVCAYSRDPDKTNYAAWEEDDPDHSGNVFGSYSDGDDVITLYDDIIDVPKDKRWTKGKTEHASSYHFPEPGGNPPPAAIAFSINETSTADFANITFAHEQTHQKLQSHNDVDTDGDGVPDNREKKVPGMDYKGSKDSFPNSFFVSGAGTFADQEFYCVLGGAFTFGHVNGMPKSDYGGVCPEQAHEENDWSVDGPNWKK